MAMFQWGIEAVGWPTPSRDLAYTVRALALWGSKRTLDLAYGSAASG